MPIRRGTRDFRIQALNDAASQGKPLEEEHVPVYRLDWEDLKAWLERRFDGLKQPTDPEVRITPTTEVLLYGTNKS